MPTQAEIDEAREDWRAKWKIMNALVERGENPQVVWKAAVAQREAAERLDLLLESARTPVVKSTDSAPGPS